MAAAAVTNAGSPVIEVLNAQIKLAEAAEDSVLPTEPVADSTALEKGVAAKSQAALVQEAAAEDSAALAADFGPIRVLVRRRRTTALSRAAEEADSAGVVSAAVAVVALAAAELVTHAVKRVTCLAIAPIGKAVPVETTNVAVVMRKATLLVIVLLLRQAAMAVVVVTLQITKSASALNR